MSANYGSKARGIREPAVPGRPVVDPAGWYASDLIDSDAWIYRLSDAEIAELRAAVAAISRRGLDIKDITRANFPLPTLGPALDDIKQELTQGLGLTLIRGLPIERMSRAEAGAAFFGMGAYLGDAISQNPMGHVLGHVKNLGKDYDDPMVRGYQTADLVRLASSEHGSRSFCGRCGSSLLCESTHHPDRVDVVLANLHGPIDREPELHVYFDDRADWVRVDDGLPRLGGKTGLEPTGGGSS